MNSRLTESIILGAPARFGAGTGFGGVAKDENGRPPLSRQESSPPGLGGPTLGSDSDNLPSAAARAAEIVKESHVASAISTVQTPKNYNQNMPQASRNAPPRPLVSATRPAPPTPSAGAPALPPKNDVAPSSADIWARSKSQGPATTTNIVPLRSESFEQAKQERQEQLRQQELHRQQERAQEEQRRQQEEKQRIQQKQQQEQQRRLDQQQKVEPVRPQLPPSKSSPATTFPITHPAQGAAGSTTGPPPVLPLQPTKKIQIQQQEKPPKPTGGVAAAAAALEKPKEKEKRISTMTEVQIMEKLRQVVSDEDPKLLYSKIKKVGQG